MIPDICLRKACIEDAEEILNIYRPVIETSAISFETSVPEIGGIRKRIVNIIKKYPWYVAETGGLLMGYAYASPHKSRDAYKWSADVSVYISSNHRQKNIGYILYVNLIRTMKELGFYNLYAGITLPNTGSIRLHEKLGFKKVGVYENVGFKCGKWQDVGWWELSLREYDNVPKEPIMYENYPDTQLDTLLNIG